jgi:hypothetical protein
MSTNSCFGSIVAEGDADVILKATSLLNQRIALRAEIARRIHITLKAWKQEQDMIVAQIDMIDPIARIISDYSGSSHGDLLTCLYQNPYLIDPYLGRKRGGSKINRVRASLEREAIRLGYPKPDRHIDKKVEDLLKQVVSSRQNRKATNDDSIDLVYRAILLLWPNHARQ